MISLQSILAILIFLVLTTLAGWLHAGTHGAILGFVIGAAAVVWKFIKV